MPRSDSSDLLVIAGRNPVFEALERDTQRLDRVLLQQGLSGGAIDAVRRRASAAGVRVQYVPSARLDRLAGGANHQGMAALAAPASYRQVDEMLAEIAPTLDDVKAKKPLLLVLDRITDPHNYGAILRSAVAAGAAGVIVPERHMAPLSAVAIKASAGTGTRIPIAQVSNLATTLEQLKERGYWIAGAAGEGDTSVWSMEWDRALALVIGSEGWGLRRSILEACDFRVTIPMKGPADSLNASVAAGILLFAATKDR